MSVTTTVPLPKSASHPISLSDQVVGRVAAGAPASIAAWIHHLAREREIGFHPRRSDIFATAASRLSDAEVDLDKVEYLLLALSRANVITPFQRGLLQVSYLR